VQAIILEPTRELASQVQTQIEKYTTLKSVLVYGGGVSREVQSKPNNEFITSIPYSERNQKEKSFHFGLHSR